MLPQALWAGRGVSLSALALPFEPCDVVLLFFSSCGSDYMTISSFVVVHFKKATTTLSMYN